MSLHIIRDYLTTKYFCPDRRGTWKELYVGHKFKGGLDHVKELLDFIVVVPEEFTAHHYYETNITYKRNMCQQTKKRNRYFK